MTISMTRRDFLQWTKRVAGGVGGAIVLNACGASSSSITPSSMTTATATVGTTTGAVSTGTGTATTTPLAGTSVIAGAGNVDAQTVTAKIVAAANAFLATLSPDQRANVLFDWTDTAQKRRWSNLPQGLFQRAGLMWGTLTNDQQQAWLAVMQTTLSNQGYARILGEWHADDALAAAQGNGNGRGGPQGMQFGSKYYWIALIGTPSESDPWMWQFGGHHVTVNATIKGANLSLTPSFIGIQPATYANANGQTVRPLGDIEDTAFALVNALTTEQQKRAVLGSQPIDLVLGPGQDGKVLQPEGLPASQMTADQQALLLKLVGYYVGLAYDAAAQVRMEQVQADLAKTYFVWYGPVAKGSAAYFRVAGPRIVIEYAPQGGGANGLGLGGAVTNQHIHGIYRDPTNDYGAGFVS